MCVVWSSECGACWHKWTAIGHEHLANFNGQVMDPLRIQQRDETLRWHPKELDLSNKTAFLEQLRSGRLALAEFVDGAVLSRCNKAKHSPVSNTQF
jgi:hypothetical protein